MVSLSHRSTHISMVRSNGKPESSVTPGPDRVRKEDKRGSHKPYMWSYSLSWITKQEGSVQRDNPLCTPTQPLIVHLCLGWINQHVIISITVFIPSRLTIITSSLYHLEAISSNSCRGHMVIIQLLNLLGLWFP